MSDRAGRDAAMQILEESRLREKRQALFYRSLAAEAESGGRLEESERLDGFLADEQHHLSRLTARVLELGGDPADLRDVPGPRAALEGWEETARAREDQEVGWYERALGGEGPDPETRAVLREILESERHQRDRLGGTWVPM